MMFINCMLSNNQKKHPTRKRPGLIQKTVNNSREDTEHTQQGNTFEKHNMGEQSRGQTD